MFSLMLRHLRSGVEDARLAGFGGAFFCLDDDVALYAALVRTKGQIFHIQPKDFVKKKKVRLDASLWPKPHWERRILHLVISAEFPRSTRP